MLNTEPMSDKSQEAYDKLRMARAKVMMENPFWGSQSLRLEPIEDQTTETIWTDGINVGYNPQYVLDTPIRMLMTDWARQVCHVVLEHTVRRGPRSKDSWSKSCNYAANAMLATAGMPLSQAALYCDELAQLSAEGIYLAIHEEPMPPEEQLSPEMSVSPEQTEQNDECESNQSCPGGSGESGSQDATQPGSDSSDNAEDTASDAQPGADGQAPSKPYKGYGEVRDCPTQKAEQAQFDAKQSLQQAVTQLESGIGHVPGDVLEALKVHLYGEVDWKEALNNYLVACSGAENYTWSRPNSNYLHLGLYMPSLRAKATPGFVFYFDTSLSVGLDEVGLAHRELAEILDKINPERVVAIYGDSKIQKVTEYFAGETPDGLAMGRGGTKLEPVFAKLDELDFDPVCLVLFTDMEVRYPPEPRVPVLWLTTRTNFVPPPYGEVLRISGNS